jgi:hypothetical protein
MDTKPVLDMMGVMVEVVGAKKDATAAAAVVGHLVKALRPRGDAGMAPVARSAAAPTMAHNAAAAGWPPPYAADKGMEQALHLQGFALTKGNGSAFVHMKPIQHFGATAELLAYRELVGRLAMALENAVLILATLEPPEAEEAEADEDPAAGDDTQCDKTGGEPATRCLLDLGHDGDCAFPEVAEPVAS